MPSNIEDLLLNVRNWIIALEIHLNFQKQRHKVNRIWRKNNR